MSEKIQITQEDIDNGVKRNPFDCAIAVGLKKEFAYNISVGDVIRIEKDNFRAMPEVIRWFLDFDIGRPVKPITIELVPYRFARKYQPKGRKPIPIYGEAHVVDTQE